LTRRSTKLLIGRNARELAALRRQYVRDRPVSRARADRAFYVSAGIYALVLLSGLLHYAFGSPMHMAVRSNVTVLAEAVIGAVLGWSLIARAATRS
jgi:hypothetical protein